MGTLPKVVFENKSAVSHKSEQTTLMVRIQREWTTFSSSFIRFAYGNKIFLKT